MSEERTANRLDETMKQRMIRALEGMDIRPDESMKKHTTFKIGGLADAMIVVRSADDILRTLQFAREENVPVTIVGNGSNLLVRDGGIRGIVMKIAEGMNESKFTNLQATVQAGCRFSLFVRESIEKNLKGLEFAGGIPGTIGGAVTMNAGAYGGCIADCLQSVTYIDEQLRLRTKTIEAGDMGYRTTIFSKHAWVVTEAGFRFQRDFDKEARAIFEKNNALRKQNQPIDLPSAGSIFKRPEGNFAGKLIQEAGCQGECIGGAQVSQKHAGFIVNTGGATAQDVLTLIEKVKRRVLAHSGVELEMEVRIVGEEE